MDFQEMKEKGIKQGCIEDLALMNANLLYL